MRYPTQTTSLLRKKTSLVHAMLAALAGSLLLGASAQAGISGINTPGTSMASIIFDDTNSSLPPSGTTLTGPSASPWNGATLVLPLTTDFTTLDFAAASMDGSFILSSNTYALNFNGISLSQAVGNTGYADLTFTFNIEFQLDGLGLPAQATLFPNFVVNGTVQSPPGSFAAIKGFINYSGVNTAGTISTFETVNYLGIWTTPGSFSATVSGIPVIGSTPALVPNTTLTLDGMISFQVDPATINAQSVQSTVPEPASLTLFGLGACVMVVGAGWRRRRH